MSGIRSCEMIKLSACLKNYRDRQSCEILRDMITKLSVALLRG